MDFTVAIHPACIFRKALFTISLRLLLPMLFTLAASASNNSGGYQHNKGYAHHDNHSGHYDSQRKHTKWPGPHKGCHIKGHHHHRDHQPEALNCLNAYATPDALWPANHKFTMVTIDGLSTLSGNAPEVTVQCVSQDEPLNGQGDGNTDYDAQLTSGNTVKLRKERAGGGNGRVYTIDFVASDTAMGESCSGSVAVEVPHHKDGKAQDDGRLFSSVEGLDCVGSNTNADPEISSDATTIATETVAYRYAVIATDSDGDTLGYRLQSSPAGMSINSDGVIEWTPEEGQAGNHDVMVIVNDGQGGNAQQAFTVMVTVRPNSAPVINSTPLLQGTEEQAYQYPVVAVDAEGDTLVFTLLSAPAGMTINAEGLIQWAPLSGSAADYAISLQVSDTQGAAVEQSYTLTIAPKPNSAPSISSTPLLNAFEDTLYQYAISATDPDNDPLRYALIAAPASMVLNGNIIIWTPDYNSAGGHIVTIEVNDGQGGLASQSFTLTVADTNRDPIISSAPLVESAEGQLYEYPLIATDPDGDPLHYALLDAPMGLTINDRGLISWLPSYDDEGQYTIRVDISDDKGGSSQQAFTLTVLGINRDPMILSAPVIIAQENTLYEYTVQASDDDGDALIYSLISAPLGMSVSAEGLVNWLPDYDSAGEHSIEIGVSDSDITISQQFMITVANSNQPPAFQYSPKLTAQENEPYSMSVTAIDNDGDTLIYSLVAAPTGMMINPFTGEINWLPDFNQAGGQSVTVQVADGQGASIDDSFVINVQNTNRLPVVGNTSVTITEDTSVSITLLASDADAGTQLSFNVVAQPANGTLSGVAPILDYTPIRNFAGTDTFIFEVSDNNGGIVQATLLITVTGVNDSPAFNGLPLNSAISGERYSYFPSVTDPDADDTLSYSLINPPVGLSVNSLSGELTWVPSNDQVGRQTFTLLVTDSAGDQASMIFDVVVEQGNLAPLVKSQPFTAAVVDNTYRYQINASDPEQEPLTYTGNIPAGMTLSETGLLIWTPNQSQVAVHPVSVAISDGQHTVEHHFDLRVVEEAPSSIPSNLGRDFWSLDDEYTEEGFNLIFIAAPVATSGTVELHTISSPYRETLYPFTIEAGEVIAIDLYYNQNQYTVDSVLQRSIHITADADVAVYGVPGSNYSVDVINPLPTHVLGTEHIILTYEPTSDIRTYNMVNVIATQDNTTVTLRPRGDSQLNFATYYRNGDEVIRILNKGDMYTLPYFVNDATGTEVLSDKPVAVFSQNNAAYVPLEFPAADRLITQAPPLELWGDTYYTAPLMTRFSDVYKVVASQDSTHVTVNGVVVITLDRGEHYEFVLDQPSVIKGSKPILLAQLATGATHREEQAEAEENYHLLDVRTFYHDYTDDKENYTTSYDVTIGPAPDINYVIVTSSAEGIGTLEVDGVPVPASAFTSDRKLSVNEAGHKDFYAQISLSPGTHTLTSTIPFGVYQDVNVLKHIGDPFMAISPSTTQYLDSYLFATPSNRFARNFINVTIAMTAISSLTMDGLPVDPGYFEPIPGTNFAYGRWAINQGAHQLEADVPFGLLVYGFDFYRSYGIMGGYALPTKTPVSAMGLNIDKPNPPLGELVCVNVQATSTTGLPIGAVPIDVQVSGAHEHQAKIFSDKNGLASHCYTGHSLGTDTVSIASSDLVQSGVINWSEAQSADIPPAIISAPITYIRTGDIYAYQVVAVDANDDALTYSLLSAPDGMSINASTGLIEWLSVSGLYDVSVEVADATGLTHVQNFKLRANAPPKFNTLPRTEIWATGGRVTASISETFDVSNDDGGRLFTRLLSTSDDLIVAGLSTPRVGSIRSLPLGDYAIHVQIEDDFGEVLEYAWTITIRKNEVPELVDTQWEHTIKAGERFTWDFDYIDANGDPNDFRVHPASIYFNGQRTHPAILPTINSDGEFVWMAINGEVGEWQFIVEVFDSFGDSDFQWLTVTVEDNPQQYDSPHQMISIGQRLEYQLDTRTLHRETAVYTVMDAPDGFVVDADGLVSWAPDTVQPGRYTITIEATDAEGNTRAYIVTVTVTDDDQSPVITSTPVTQARTELGYHYQLEAVDPQDDPLLWRLGTGAPAGMTVDAHGLLLWSPTEADIGLHQLTIEVEDSNANIDVQQYELTVTGPGSSLWNRRQCR